MRVLTIRYSWQQLAALVAFGFLVATALETLKAGVGFIARAWSSPVFWGLMISGLSLIALALWAIPAARLSTDNVSTFAYPFRVRWTEIKHFKVSVFFGFVWLRIYGTKSRFAIWIPMPRSKVQSIYSFLQGADGAEAILSAFADKRLNSALRGDGPRPADSAHS
jgi:hypothetical protein